MFQQIMLKQIAIGQKNELDPCLKMFFKIINQKWNKDITVGVKTMKLLGENYDKVRVYLA